MLLYHKPGLNNDLANPNLTNVVYLENHTKCLSYFLQMFACLFVCLFVFLRLTFRRSKKGGGSSLVPRVFHLTGPLEGGEPGR